MSRFEKGDIVFNSECGDIYMVVAPASYLLQNDTTNLKISVRADKLRPATKGERADFIQKSLAIIEKQQDRLEEQARILHEAEEDLKYEDL